MFVGERERRLLEDQRSEDLRPQHKISLEERDAELGRPGSDCPLDAEEEAVRIDVGLPGSSLCVEAHIDLISVSDGQPRLL